MRVALCFFALFALSGCISADHVDEGYVAYKGTTIAMSWSYITCGDQVQLDFRASIGEGRAVATVKDGAGNVTFTYTVEAPGSYQNTLPLGGAPGDWRVEVDRQGDRFQGSYEAKVVCVSEAPAEP